MQLNIKGEIHIFGDNIDTDQIYPGRYLELTSPQEIAAHCLDGADENFSLRFIKGGLVVAGKNFGCGSSREHAAISLKNLGVSAVIAESFARIFYRNAINMGLPLIACSEINEIVKTGDVLSVDLKRGIITNMTSGKTAVCEPISEYAMRILDAGGIKPLLLQDETGNAEIHNEVG